MFSFLGRYLYVFVEISVLCFKTYDLMVGKATMDQKRLPCQSFWYWTRWAWWYGFQRRLLQAAGYDLIVTRLQQKYADLSVQVDGVLIAKLIQALAKGHAHVWAAMLTHGTRLPERPPSPTVALGGRCVKLEGPPCKQNLAQLCVLDFLEQECYHFLILYRSMMKDSPHTPMTMIL